MVWLGYLAVVAAGYFLGSIPTGYLVARARGVDIRKTGSGNIGATNAFRVLGPAAGATVLLIDAAKGALACWLAGRLPGWLPGGEGFSPEAGAGGYRMAAGIAAILGHNYTCWLRFKGGKGIATSAGVFLALAPWAILTALGVWGVALALTRYVSVASIAAAAALPVAVWATGGGGTLTGISVLLAALAIYKHRSNLRRLRDGTEARLGRKTTTQGTP